MATRIMSRALAGMCIAAGVGLGCAGTAAGEQSVVGLDPVVCTVTDLDEALDPLEEALEPVTGECPEPDPAPSPEPEPSPSPDPGPSPSPDPRAEPDPPPDAPDEPATQDPDDGDGRAGDTSSDSRSTNQGGEPAGGGPKADAAPRRAVPMASAAPGGVRSADALAAKLAAYSANVEGPVPEFGYLGDVGQSGPTGGMSAGWAATLQPQPAADFLPLLLATLSVAGAGAALARRWTNRGQGAATVEAKP